MGKGANRGRAGSKAASARSRPPGAPTPEERAEVVVIKLERFIREGRSSTSGVSFKSWQGMAKAEIAAALKAAETQEARAVNFVDRLMLLGGAALSTIGVWGTALAIDQAPDRILAAVLILLAGLALLWIAGALWLRAPLGRFRDRRRRDALQRVDDLHRQVRRLEIDLKSRAKQLQAERDAQDEAS